MSIWMKMKLLILQQKKSSSLKIQSVHIVSESLNYQLNSAHYLAVTDCIVASATRNLEIQKFVNLQVATPRSLKAMTSVEYWEDWSKRWLNSNAQIGFANNLGIQSIMMNSSSIKWPIVSIKNWFVRSKAVIKW